MKDCRKCKGVDLFDDINNKKFITKDIKVWQWICIAVGVAVCLVSTWIDWNGSKVVAEFKSRGPLLFPFQYIYYLFEVSLVLLIIIHQRIPRFSGNPERFERFIAQNIIFLRFKPLFQVHMHHIDQTFR